MGPEGAIVRLLMSEAQERARLYERQLQAGLKVKKQIKEGRKAVRAAGLRS